MSDTELQDALRAGGWAIMPHHGPGPRWSAVHGAGHVIGTICALRSGGYTVRGMGEGCTVEVQVATAGEVGAAWVRVAEAVGMLDSPK